MSWRETLGVAVSTEISHAHNAHNTQKTSVLVNCADIADSAYKNSADDESRLMEDLSDACQGLPITSPELRKALAVNDILAWHNGDLSKNALTTFARLLVQRRDMNRGKRPENYTERAICNHCGPIWLWVAGKVMGCPWCWNRAAGYPIPRPFPVRCGDCTHYKRIAHPHLGHCSKGEPEAVAGNWDTDRRWCDYFILAERISTNRLLEAHTNRPIN